MKKFKAIGFLMLLGFLTSCGGGSDGGVSIPILGGDARLNDSAQGLMGAQLNGTFDTTPAPSVREKFISASYSLDGETKTSVKPFLPTPSAAAGDATTATTLACTGRSTTKNNVSVYELDSGRTVANGTATKTLSYYHRDPATQISCPQGSPNPTVDSSNGTLFAIEKQQDTFSIASATAGALPSPLVDGSKVDVTLTYHRDDVETYTVTANTPDLDLDGTAVTGTTSSSSKEDGTHVFRMAFNQAANTFQLVADIPVTVTQVDLTSAGQPVTATAVTLELKDVTAGGTSPSLCSPAGNTLCEGTVARSTPTVPSNIAVFINSSAAIGDIDFGGRAVASATPTADTTLAGATVKISAGISGTGTAAGLYTFTVSADNGPGTSYTTTRSFLMNVQ